MLANGGVDIVLGETAIEVMIHSDDSRGGRESGDISRVVVCFPRVRDVDRYTGVLASELVYGVGVPVFELLVAFVAWMGLVD